MKERPIPFLAHEVQATLSGTQTQFRRIAKVPPHWSMPPMRYSGGYLYRWGGTGDERIACPYGKPGDHLWVRETWGCPQADHPRCKDGRKPQRGDKIVYRAKDADAWQWDRLGPGRGDFCWRPSIHMPRWASRITLEVTGVRVERVQEIRTSDIDAEGLPIGRGLGGSQEMEFRKLWDSINSKRGYGWDKNCWVWVVEFKRIRP